MIKKRACNHRYTDVFLINKRNNNTREEMEDRADDIRRSSRVSKIIQNKFKNLQVIISQKNIR